MNNPLDDIYNDHLKNRSYEFQESDWLGAKRMLDLQEKKHRIPIWFWIGVAIMSIAGMAHVQYSPEQEEQKQEEIIANLIPNTIQEINTKSTEEVINAEANNSTDYIKKDLQSTLNNIDAYSNLENKNNKELDLEIAQRDSKNKTQKFATPPSSSNSAISSNSVIDKNSNYPNTPVRQGQVFTNFRNTLRHTSPALSGDPSTTDLSKDPTNKKATEVIKDSSIAKGATKSDRINLYSLTTQLSLLSILPLKNKIPFVKYKDRRLEGLRNTMVNCCRSKKLGFKIYTAYTTPSPNYSAGLQLEYPLYNNLHIATGAGINWNSSFSIFSENQDATSGRNMAFNSVLNERIDIRRLSVEIPISLSYHFRRHYVSSGILLNKAILSERKNESSLMSLMESFDPTAPGMDLTEPLTQNPITVRQSSVSTDDPALLSWDTYFTIGYGYKLTPRLDLGINAHYRLSKVPTIQSTLADTQYELDIPKYSARFTLLYNF